MDATRLRRVLPLILAFLAMTAVEASAQTLPWPTDPRPATGPGPAAVTQPQMVPPPQAGLPGGNPPPCFAEFTKLRQEVEKRVGEAKAGRDRKASREEMCKLIQSYAAAEGKWLKYTQDNMASCGIPPQAVEQIKGGHARTLVIRKQICSAGPPPGAAAAQPATPSLSDALGTTRLPVPDTAKTGRSFLDTLTGNAIAK